MSILSPTSLKEFVLLLEVVQDMSVVMLSKLSWSTLALLELLSTSLGNEISSSDKSASSDDSVVKPKSLSDKGSKDGARQKEDDESESVSEWESHDKEIGREIGIICSYGIKNQRNTCNTICSMHLYLVDLKFPNYSWALFWLL